MNLKQEIMMIENRNCKQCGQELLGRSDQKFCSSNCRSRYHNENNTDKRVFISYYFRNKEEIQDQFKRIKLIIRTSIDQIRERKDYDNNNSEEDLDVKLELAKNYDLLSQIREIENLLYN